MTRAENRLTTHHVVGEVFAERLRQDRLHGGQLDLPDGTGRPGDVQRRDAAQAVCNKAKVAGTLTFRDIVAEEILELFAETDPVLAEREAIQAAASLCKWVEAMRRRAAPGRFADAGEPSLFPEGSAHE